MMFWRLLWRLLQASRARLTVALVAIVGGAAVSAALLNLHLDAERKLTQEFRALGANVLIAPPQPGSAEPALADSSVAEKVVTAAASDLVGAAPFLYVVAQVGEGQKIVVAGTWLDEMLKLSPWWRIQGQQISTREDNEHSLVGANAAKLLNVAPGGHVRLSFGGRTAELQVAGIVSAGSPEDNQILLNLNVAQRLAGLPGKMGIMQLSVRGTPEHIDGVVAKISRMVPELSVRPIRQIAQAEGQLLARIRLLIFATVGLILLLTALCVLATMAALAMERRRDVGLMKALGGSMQRVIRLFMTEVALLGVTGGVMGWAGGILLSRWIGQATFGTAIEARLEVLPFTVALMVGVALAGALPLRLLGNVRPALILRGE
ncbi:MAG: FtsX-like permease family protein [Acidobacteria bacterium]|nr:FtsX-like permease family protein [Acidobacteriota bacterium]